MGKPSLADKDFLTVIETAEFYGLSTRKLFRLVEEKNLPLHMYCADIEENVRMCIEKGADLITANDPVPLMTVLGRM